MVGKPALLVLVFAAANRLDEADGAGRRWLAGLWESLERLNLDQAIDGVAPAGFPAEFGAGGRFRVLASREAAGRGIRQALLFGVHDTVGLLALLAPRPSQDWRRLSEAWAEATGEADPEHAPPAVFGAAFVHLGLVPSAAAGDPEPPPTPTALLRAKVPDGRAAAFPTEWTRTSRGFLVAEFGPADAADQACTRHLVLLASKDQEAELDEWAWSSARELPPFARYLLHAAKVRYQFRVFERDQAFRAARQRVEEAVDKLMHLNASEADPHKLSQAQQALAVEEAEADGLITALSRIRAMTRTVEIAAANMRTAIPPAPAPAARQGSSPLFEQDELDATWLRDLLLDDAEYLQATLDRAGQIGRLVASQVEQRQSRYQQQLTLVQTSVIGALLMALAAMQTLQYKVPLPGPLQPPVIAVLASVTLTLPGAVLRWIRGVGADAPLRRADLASLALLGAALGWLATSAVSRQLLHHLAGPATTVLVAVSTAAAFLALGSIGLRQLSRTVRDRRIRKKDSDH